MLHTIAVAMFAWVGLNVLLLQILMFNAARAGGLDRRSALIKAARAPVSLVGAALSRS